LCVSITIPDSTFSLASFRKNRLDWISRVREDGEQPYAAFRNRVFALGAASNGSWGGMRSLMALRQTLEIGMGALVLPEQVAVREASKAFDDRDNLTDERAAGALRAAVRRLVDMARQMV